MLRYPRGVHLRDENLFHGAKARANVNGKLSQEFVIEGQGCLVEPYLFFIINELLNVTIKAQQPAGKLQGIKLPRSNS